MTGDKAVGLIAYVLRCTAAAAIAYLLASAAGMRHPLWACIFALIASQDSVATALTTIAGRVTGTIIGVVVAVAVNAATSRFGLDGAWQMVVAVAICAIFAWGRPAIQVCLWTPPIILMSAAPTESILRVGFYRGCEVILGVLVGGFLHIAADKGGEWARSRPR